MNENLLFDLIFLELAVVKFVSGRIKKLESRYGSCPSMYTSAYTKISAVCNGGATGVIASTVLPLWL